MVFGRKKEWRGEKGTIFGEGKYPFCVEEKIKGEGKGGKYLKRRKIFGQWRRRYMEKV